MRNLSTSPLRLALLLLLISCGENQNEQALHPRQEHPERRFVVANQWDTVGMVGGTLQDTVMARPEHLRFFGDGLAIFDNGSNRLLMVDASGEIELSLGGRGSGPTEFGIVQDMEPDGTQLLLLDRTNQRIAIVSAEGYFVGHVPVSMSSAHQITPLDSDMVAISAFDPDESLALVNRDGEVSRVTRSPWLENGPIEGQGLSASSPGSQLWVYALSVVDGWYKVRGVDVEEPPISYLEEVVPPEVIPTEDGVRVGRYTRAAIAVSLAGDVLHVLFGGEGPAAGRIVDRYAATTGHYLGSYQLPWPAVALDVSGTIVAVAVQDPLPAVLILGMRDSLAYPLAPVRQ